MNIGLSLPKLTWMINNVTVNVFSLVGPILSRQRLISVRLLHLIIPSDFSWTWTILKIENNFKHIFPIVEILLLLHSA